MPKNSLLIIILIDSRETLKVSICVQAGNCTADEFRCKSQDTNNVTKCVSSQLVCDKRINCPDDDDDEEEKMCEQSKCHAMGRLKNTPKYASTRKCTHMCTQVHTYVHASTHILRNKNIKK